MDLIAYALLFIGTPYGWGANGGGQYDCSGFSQEILKIEGIDPPGDQTAQALHDKLEREFRTIPMAKKKSMLFFGKDVDMITHVSLAINDYQMIEAGGGGSKTITKEDAIRDNAMVRIRQINSRTDLVAIIDLNI